MTTQPTEAQANCIVCKKPIKKVKCYYREGNYYCNKKCWLKTKSSPKEGQQAA